MRWQAETPVVTVRKRIYSLFRELPKVIRSSMKKFGGPLARIRETFEIILFFFFVEALGLCINLMA